jgi:hypothetical protein
MESRTNQVPAKGQYFHLGAMRFSMAQFLGALVLLFVAEPFIELIPNGRVIELGLITLVLLSAVLAVSRVRRTLVTAIVLVLPALVGRWAHDVWSARLFPAAGLVPSLVFIAYVIMHLLRYILRAPRVNSEVLYAGIATYLMLGLFWANFYSLASCIVPNAFTFTTGTTTGQSVTGFTALYFSFVTLSTVGYGDIIPAAPAVKSLAVAEATVGMIYMTVLIARLVALYSTENPENK